MITLGQVKTSRVRRVAASCPSSEDFLALLNDATEILMKRGNWWGTVKKIQFCAWNNCLVFPRQVGTLLATNRCNGSIPPKNQWYSFNDVFPDDVNRYNVFFNGPGPCANNFVTEDQGTTSVFNQIPCLNDRYVQFYPSRLSDIGKTITVYGVDGNGLVIRTERPDGTFLDGVVLTLATPFVQSPFLIRRVDRIVKDVTAGEVYGYQFDGANRYELAWYQPTETTPEYRFVKLRADIGGCCHTVSPCACGPISFTALVKLQFVPVVTDNDLVLIDDLDALALAVQSVKASDAGDSGQAESFMARAVHELNLKLRDKLPIAETPTRVWFQGTAHMANQAIGYLV